MGNKGTGTTPNNESFRRAVPGLAGQLKCECTIWGNKPIYRRRRQDQGFIFSPETLKLVPEGIREKLDAIPGIDGVFLNPRVEYQHNFICATKKTESEDPDEKNPARANEKASNVIPLERLEFYDQINTELLIDGNGNSILSLDGNEAAQALPQASHHMWVNTGSLFSPYVVRPSEVNEFPESEADRLRYRFSAKWGYSVFNAAANSSNAEGIERDSSPNWIRPSQKANKTGSPANDLAEITGDVLSEFTVSGGSDDVYKDINPGIHWRVVKRTSLFQGEDFFVEFKKEALSSDIPELGRAKFKMQQEFNYVDINSVPTDGTGTIPQEALIELDGDGNVNINALKKFDFSRQSYYMIQLGVDADGPYDKTEKDENGSPRTSGKSPNHGHEYWIIIPEKSSPIFCHAGIVYELKPVEETGETESEADSAQDQENCQENSDDGTTQGRQRTVDLSDSKKLRRLSTYRGATGRSLMEQENLRVTVRQHLGRLVVTFSGYEDNPWVISRADLTPREDNEKDEEPKTEEDFLQERVPMVIAPAPIAIMGGNRKCSFTFGALTYDEVANTTLPQPLSILGPVDKTDIQLLLRDKGMSRVGPNAGSQNRSNSSNQSSNEDSYEFTQDAEIFAEVIKNRTIETAAIDIQPEAVFLQGKAPNAQQNGAAFGRTQSEIGLSMRECASNIGSESPNVKQIQVLFRLIPGDYLFPSIDGDGDEGNGWMYQRCITPIVTGYRLYVPASGVAYEKNEIDISHHVMSYEEAWSEQDMLQLEHSGTIKFLINAGMEFQDENNYAPYIASLADKAFYLQLAVWWEGGVMPLSPRQRDRVLITGICHGGEITFENNKRVMTCEVEDYMGILRNQLFMNSPFFDKMRDFNAVYEILQLAGFRDGTNADGDVTDSTQPASLLRTYTNRRDEEEFFFTIHNGETILNREYALPGAYDILQEPFLRFRDGEKYYDALVRMSTLSGKVMYFDRLGVFHFDMLPYEQDLFNFQQREGRDSDFEPIDYERLAKVKFIASPDATDSPEVHRQVFNAYTVKRHVEDVVNDVRIISTTPNGELLIAGHTNFDSLFDADSPGFLGYPKQFIQMDGIFGDEQTVKWVLKNYTKMFIPPLSIRFEAVGHNNIKALDVVTFQGLGMREPQPLIVGNVSSTIDPASNTWMQKFECYWLFPSTNIEFGETDVVGVSATGSLSP